MKNFLFVFIVLFLISCNNKAGDSSSNSIDLNDYKLEKIKGTSIQKAVMLTEEGKVKQEGFVDNGVKTGEWVEYNDKNDKLSSITSYLNGKLNGYYFEFDNRGYLVTQAGFINDELDGKLIKLKYGKATEITHYKNGKLHGLKTQYHRNGKKQVETEYKDGVIDGYMRYYNDDEQIMMETNYKNGEKVGQSQINNEIDAQLK